MMNDIKIHSKHKRSSILSENLNLEKFNYKEDNDSNKNTNSLSLTKNKTGKMLSWNNKLVDVINVESYKKHNFSEDDKDRQLRIQKMREKIKCKCSIF